MEHAVVPWLIEHAAMALANYHEGSDDNLTGYERLHGRAYKSRMPELREAGVRYIPTRQAQTRCSLETWLLSAGAPGIPINIYCRQATGQ